MGTTALVLIGLYAAFLGGGAMCTVGCNASPFGVYAVPAIPAVLGTAVSTGLAWLTDRRSGVLLVVPAAVSVAMIVGGAVLVWYVFGFGPRNL